MFFVVSKIFWFFAQPISLCCLLVLGGGVLVARGRRHGGLAVGGMGLLVMMLSAYTSLGYVMIGPLEARFQAPTMPPDNVSTIIMLGGATVGRVSAARGITELNDAGDRVMETLRLAQLYPKARVVLSGGSGVLDGEDESEAAIVARLLEAMGVAPERLVLEEKSRNTAENAAMTRAEIGIATGTTVLVTSAFHMPRAMGLFEKAGLDVIAWPVDYRGTGSDRLGIDLVNPVANLVTTGVAMREWIGLLVYAATGRINSVFPG